MINNSKLIFNYGAMNSGKTKELLKVRYSKKEDGFNPILMKPYKDDKGDDTVVSRDNSFARVDFLIKDMDNIYFEISKYILDYNVDYIIVDEVQFFTEVQIDQLGAIVDEFGIDVICYGLLTDFQGKMFDASKRLMEIADDRIEMERQCVCGRKRIFNARFVNDQFVLDGEQVAIDGKDVEYKSRCRQCYKKLVKQLNVKDK